MFRYNICKSSTLKTLKDINNTKGNLGGKYHLFININQPNMMYNQYLMDLNKFHKSNCKFHKTLMLRSDISHLGNSKDIDFHKNIKEPSNFSINYYQGLNINYKQDDNSGISYLSCYQNRIMGNFKYKLLANYNRNMVIYNLNNQYFHSQSNYYS